MAEKRIKFRRLNQATIEEENEAFNIAKDYLDKNRHPNGFIELSQLGECRFIVDQANAFLKHIILRNDMRKQGEDG